MMGKFWEYILEAYLLMFFVLILAALVFGPIVLAIVFEVAWILLAYLITIPLAFAIFVFVSDDMGWF